VLGAVAEDERLALAERHLGLKCCSEIADASERVRAIGRIIAAQVDLEQVRALGASAGAGFDTPPAAPMRRARTDLRIGIARDRAFGFYYPDDLQALEDAGATLVPFDTLRDQRLPAMDGLFIGGGFPEACMDELEANVALRAALREAIEDGLPAYAECGGLMYLARSITWRGRTARMVGAIPGDAVMHERPVGRGYMRLSETSAMPWPDRCAASAPAGPVNGHEFHHSSLENLPAGTAFAYRVQRGHGIDGKHDGLLVHNLLASYAHLRSAAGADWAERFAAFVRETRQRRAQPAALDALALSV
jgi:cobyrinic acid a,c-diamide synthase